MITFEEPVTKPNDRDGTVTTHPAFGQISAARQHGGGYVLYGSDFVHNSTVSITIYASELHRGLSHDHHYANREVIEVVLSESQWATFVSSLNAGSGPPCTIQHVEAERKPRIPLPKDRQKQFGGEMVETLQDAVKRLDDAMVKISESGLSVKKSGAIIHELRMAKQEMEKNIPFVAEQFEEMMETTTEKAKQEIHGYLNGQIARAGIKALSSGEEVLSLETKGDA